jgi:hypothetical protein
MLFSEHRDRLPTHYHLINSAGCGRARVLSVAPFPDSASLGRNRQGIRRGYLSSFRLQRQVKGSDGLDKRLPPWLLERLA